MAKRIVVALKDGTREVFGGSGGGWAITENLGFISVIRVSDGNAPEVVREFLSDDVDHVESDD